MTTIEKQGDGGSARREEIRGMARWRLGKRERWAPVTTPRGLEFSHLAQAGFHRRSAARNTFILKPTRADRLEMARQRLSLSIEYRLDSAPVLP